MGKMITIPIMNVTYKDNITGHFKVRVTGISAERKEVTVIDEYGKELVYSENIFCKSFDIVRGY